MDKVIVSGKIVLGNHLSQVQNCRRGRLMEPNMEKRYLTQQISLWVWHTDERRDEWYFFFTSLHLFIMAELTLTTLLHRWQWFAFASQRHQTTNHLWHPIDSLCLRLLFLTCELISVCSMQSRCNGGRDLSNRSYALVALHHVTAYFGGGPRWEQQ